MRMRICFYLQRSSGRALEKGVEVASGQRAGQGGKGGFGELSLENYLKPLGF